MMTLLIDTVLIWFVISQALAWLICRGSDDEQQVVTIHAGFFMLPAFAGWIFVAWLTWHLLRFANYMRVPWIEPAAENFLEYL